MFDESYLRTMQLINYYEAQTERFLLGLPSAWNPFAGKLGEYLRYGHRRLKHYV